MINVEHVIDKNELAFCPLCKQVMLEPEQVIVVISDNVKALAHVDCTLNESYMDPNG